jgi:hypothetical protein
LTTESVRFVLDLVESPPQDTPNKALKEDLFSSHQQTNFQKIDCARKPYELLAKMKELCPRQQEINEIFLYLFLQQIPRETAHHGGGQPR